MDFTEIWNEAYNIYTEQGKAAMWTWLEQKVKQGEISDADMRVMASDIFNTASL